MKMALTLLAGACAVIVLLSSAHALPGFQKEFKAKYVKEDGDATQKAFAEKVDKVKCNVCHGKNAETGKDDKKVRNAYGLALDALLDKKTDAKDVEKIQKALETVEGQKPEGGAKTFGELIKEGNLPGGEP